MSLAQTISVSFFSSTQFSILRISVISPWYFHYIFMVSPLYLHGISMVFPLYLHGISIISPWYLHYISIISPWYFHYMSMVSPLYLHGISMVFHEALIMLQWPIIKTHPRGYRCGWRLSVRLIKLYYQIQSIIIPRFCQHNLSIPMYLCVKMSAEIG